MARSSCSLYFVRFVPRVIELHLRVSLGKGKDGGAMVCVGIVDAFDARGCDFVWVPLAVTILPPSATDGPRASLRVCCLALV